MNIKSQLLKIAELYRKHGYVAEAIHSGLNMSSHQNVSNDSSGASST